MEIISHINQSLSKELTFYIEEEDLFEENNEENRKSKRKGHMLTKYDNFECQGVNTISI